MGGHFSKFLKRLRDYIGGQLMKALLRYLTRLFHQLLPFATLRDLKRYRRECDQLAEEYQDVLSRISKFMETNGQYLKAARDPSSEDLTLSPEELNTFNLFALREQLEGVTQQCDVLLTAVQNHPSHSNQHEELLKVIQQRLQELRDYSDQIEEALRDYETRLLELEEDRSQRYLLN